MTQHALARVAAALIAAALLLGALPAPLAAQPAEPQATYAIYLPLLRSGQPAAAPQPGPLAGTWIWQRDSDGTTPSPGSECSLTLVTGGEATASCFRPGEEVADTGSYSLAGPRPDGGSITIELPGLGISAAAQPYSRSGDTLTLPFTLINGVPGSSTWRFQPIERGDPSDPVDLAFYTYETALIAGLSDEAAAEAAAAALRAGSFPAEGGAGVAAAETLEVTLNGQKTTLRLRRERGGREYYIFLKPKSPQPYRFAAGSPLEPLTPGPLAADPRTQLYMEPGDGLNDPVDYTAALLFPVHSQVHMRKGRSFSFRGLGENPDVLRKQLLRAGYRAEDITVKVDGELSPKTLAEVLLTSPGLVYISTHGVSYPADEDGPASFTMLTGTRIEPRAGESVAQALTRQVAEMGLPAYLAEHVGGSWLQTGRSSDDRTLFMSVSSGFFKALREKNPGWNMSRSFVYLDICESTQIEQGETQPVAVGMFKAAVVLGWTNTPDPLIGVKYSQFIFRNLVRKTHSVREVWDHLWRVAKGRRTMYPEDSGLDDEDGRYRMGAASEVDNFTAYGADGKPYKRLGAGLYPNTHPDDVAWLVWLGRWNTDPEQAAKNLESCYVNIWSKGIRGLAAGPLCNAGYRGSHTPTANEVKEARQLLVGLPLPLPGDRWALADARPYASPLGTPFD